MLFSLLRGSVALVMVYLREGEPACWEQATPPGFSVDSATGCLMDYRVNRYLYRRAQADRYGVYCRRFERSLGLLEGSGGSHTVDRRSGANVILSRTWGGDGFFPAYIGYGLDGGVNCLVLDMFLPFEIV